MFFSGEIDTRFSFCAVATLALLVGLHYSFYVLLTFNVIYQSITFLKTFFSSLKGKMDTINLDKAVDFVLSSMNFDGGFGCRPGSESHAGQVSYSVLCVICT